MTIFRSKTKATGGITSVEREKLNEHAKLWIKRAFRTDPIDPEKIVPAIKGIYAAAGLKEPRVVIAPSPLVMAFAYGAAAAAWHRHKAHAKATPDATRAAISDATRVATSAATRVATDAATYDATSAATRVATDAATYDATSAAIYDATRVAARAATSAATSAATDAATRAATDAATYVATDAATRAATDAATSAATRAATYDATRSATDVAARDATSVATRVATSDATSAATSAATRAATYDATSVATRVATRVATSAATYVATDAATYVATYVATSAATRAATDAATSAATSDATYAATYDATSVATRDATRVATSAATYVATDAATYAATYDATSAAIYDATSAATSAAEAAQACYDIAGELGLACADSWHRAYQGGNMWAGYDCYLTGMRDIIGLDLPEHVKYAFWEQAAIEGGFRVMHEEFCIVSDFPLFIKVDENNRPHSDDGPSHLWRDGWALYHFHGVRVPSHWIEDKANLKAPEVMTCGNLEQRRAGIEILGWDKILSDLDARVIDEDGDPQIGTLLEVTLPDLTRPARFLRVQCGTGRQFAVGVPPEIRTAIEAQAWMTGLPVKDFSKPEIRS